MTDTRTQAITALTAENERFREALAEIVEHCKNDGYGNPIVNERIVNRCEDTATAALKGQSWPAQIAPRR